MIRVIKAIYGQGSRLMHQEGVRRQVSGHSARVVATQDLLALNMDLATVIREGRWTSVRMPVRHGEHVMAVRGWMARRRKSKGGIRSGPEPTSRTQR